MNRQTDVPKRIDVQREAGVMEIEWKGGETDRIGLPDLRKFCPCALCVDHREKQVEESGLHMLTDAEASVSAEVQEVIAVGRYAIQIVWGDGHNTGIYTYAYLRELSGERD